MSLRDLLQKGGIIGLSPMDGITDEAFRLTQCHVAKPNLIFTEFVSAEGIAHGAVKLFDQLLFSSVERPIVGQLFGKDPQSFYIASIILCHLGFDGIDINMGCPARTVTQHGSGAALIGKPELASQIIKSVQQAVADFTSGKVKIGDLGLKQKTLEVIERNLKYSLSKLTTDKLTSDNLFTVSVKTRLGINESIIDTWIPFLLSHNLDFLTVHGRTLSQGYSGQANWNQLNLISELCAKNNTPFIANGDIASLSQAKEFIKKYHLTGVLIGRAAMGNPWVFSENSPNWSEKFQAMVFHTQKFVDVFPTRRLDPLRRHYLTYTHNHPRAKQLRTKIVTLTTIDQLLSLESEFCS